MTEGIEYHPIGTVDVTFDDKTYHLGPPKLKQWRYFTRQMDAITTKATDDFVALTKRLGEAQQAIIDAADSVLAGTYALADEKTQGEEATRVEVQAREIAWQHLLDDADPELREAYDTVTEELSEFAQTPFYMRSSGLVAEIFKQLGDPLPDDIEDWPAWLATDIRLPGSLLAHWRTNPKASGSNGAR